MLISVATGNLGESQQNCPVSGIWRTLLGFLVSLTKEFKNRLKRKLENNFIDRADRL